MKHTFHALLLFSLLTPLVISQTFQHPGVLVSQSQLNFIKQQVAAKAEPFYSAYQKAVSSSFGDQSVSAQGPPSNVIILTFSLLSSATPLFSIYFIDSNKYSDPDYGCSADDHDSTTAYVQSLLWVITGNKQYATNAISLLNRYASNLKSFTNANAPLQAAWSAQKWTKAAEIIRHTNAGWSESDISAYSKLLTSVYLPRIQDGSSSNGNWELSMIDGMFGIAVFTESWSLFNHTASYWKQRVPAYFYYEPLDGKKPAPAPRGDASWYGETVFNASVNGLCQETCRDLGHTQFGLTSAINAAETAHIQGLDLYGSEGPRLMAALEFNTRLLLGDAVPSYLCGTGKVTLEAYPTFEVAYNEYHNRTGHSLPNTLKQITTHVRTMSSLTDSHTCVWETLTHGGSP